MSGIYKYPMWQHTHLVQCYPYFYLIGRQVYHSNTNRHFYHTVVVIRVVIPLCSPYPTQKIQILSVIHLKKRNVLDRTEHCCVCKRRNRLTVERRRSNFSSKNRVYYFCDTFLIKFRASTLICIRETQNKTYSNKNRMLSILCIRA